MTGLNLKPTFESSRLTLVAHLNGFTGEANCRDFERFGACLQIWELHGHWRLAAAGGFRFEIESRRPSDLGFSLADARVEKGSGIVHGKKRGRAFMTLHGLST